MMLAGFAPNVGVAQAATINVSETVSAQAPTPGGGQQDPDMALCLMALALKVDLTPAGYDCNAILGISGVAVNTSNTNTQGVNNIDCTTAKPAIELVNMPFTIRNNMDVGDAGLVAVVSAMNEKSEKFVAVIEQMYNLDFEASGWISGTMRLSPSPLNDVICAANVLDGQKIYVGANGVPTGYNSVLTTTVSGAWTFNVTRFTEVNVFVPSANWGKEFNLPNRAGNVITTTDTGYAQVQGYDGNDPTNVESIIMGPGCSLTINTVWQGTAFPVELGNAHELPLLMNRFVQMRDQVQQRDNPKVINQYALGISNAPNGYTSTVPSTMSAICTTPIITTTTVTPTVTVTPTNPIVANSVLTPAMILTSTTTFPRHVVYQDGYVSLQPGHKYVLWYKYGGGNSYYIWQHGNTPLDVYIDPASTLTDYYGYTPLSSDLDCSVNGPTLPHGYPVGWPQMPADNVELRPCG